jgi:hypothetical protein
LVCLHKQKFEKLGLERNWSFAQYFLGARRMSQKQWAQSAKKNILCNRVERKSLNGAKK